MAKSYVIFSVSDEIFIGVPCKEEDSDLSFVPKVVSSIEEAIKYTQTWVNKQEQEDYEINEGDEFQVMNTSTGACEAELRLETHGFKVVKLPKQK